MKLYLKHILLYEKSITIQYLVKTVRVFEYYSEITNGPNTNSTIWSQLFEYQIIRIIRCNSALDNEVDFVDHFELKVINSLELKENDVSLCCFFK